MNRVVKVAIWLVAGLPALAVQGQTISAHLRVEPQRGAVVGWHDSIGTAVQVEFSNVHPDNDWSTIPLRIRNGSQSIESQWPAGMSMDAVSLLLTATPDSTVLELAHARDRLRHVMPTTISLNGPLVTAVKRARILRDECKATPAEASPARLAAFESLEDLYTYLRSSADPREGLWRHYDFKTSPLKATLQSTYTLATVYNPDTDGYDIVYIHGAESPVWSPLDIKGRMKPSPVPEMYDLEWITADCESISHHSWATLDADSILTFAFPQWQATLRLARVQIPGK